jgi:hypothetical protein
MNLYLIRLQNTLPGAVKPALKAKGDQNLHPQAAFLVAWLQFDRRGNGGQSRGLAGRFMAKQLLRGGILKLRNLVEDK